MNIFYTDHDTVRCAQDHVDRHVVKMTLEYAQILSSAQRFYRGNPGQLIHPSKGILLESYPYVLEEEREDKIARLCLMSHMNHPCTMWARSSTGNYLWLYSLYVHLCGEYFYRYGQHHNPPRNIANYRFADLLAEPPSGMPVTEFTPPPKCIPEEFKIGSTMDSYRKYIQFGKKSSLHRWKDRDLPDWWKCV